MFRILLSSGLAGILGAFCVLASPVPAAAQAGMTGTPVPVCIARVQPGSTALQMLRSTESFDCDTVQTRYGAGDFWVRSAPLRRSGPLAIRIPSLWQDRMTLYGRYADGTIASATLDERGVSRHLQLGAIVEQDLPARPAPLVRLLWRVERSANVRAVLRDVRVASPEQSVRSNLLMGSLYAAFGGLCVALLCHNLALWGALRHRFQLAYCAMVLGLLLYAVSSSGALAWIWPDIANTARLRINYLTLGLSAVAAVSFARTFFEPRVFAGSVARIVAAAQAVMLAATFAFALFAPWNVWAFDRLYSFAFLAQMAVVAPILWRAWATRSNYLWVFALAWAAPIALACVRVASALSFVRWSFWVDNSTILSMTVEALLSSLAIAYRMRLLSIERDEARDGETAARLLADTDPLTGLLNRRAFLHQTIGREGEQVLMIADLDHFKRVNDTIGHDGGDEVLRVFARTLRQAVPADALVARIGGEEFAVVVPAGSPVEPEDVLARLRAGRMPYDVAVTASIGTCTGPLLREMDWKALYACADRALFDAKTAGRDRVRDRALPDRLAA